MVMEKNKLKKCIIGLLVIKKGGIKMQIKIDYDNLDIPDFEGILVDKSWKFIESPAHQMDESGFEEFDSTFEQMEKGYSYTQELFYIYSRSNVLR